MVAGVAAEGTEGVGNNTTGLVEEVEEDSRGTAAVIANGKGVNRNTCKVKGYD